VRANVTQETYERMVVRAQEYIRAGDIFQVCLAQRFEASWSGDPWALFLRLAATNPAPFAAFLPDRDLTVLSASPERFLRLTPDGAIETRPIKGTAPRGAGPEADAAQAARLRASAKDRAENAMIVDLLRNDLGRVSTPGSVRVAAFAELEAHPTVHHLVSTVTGRLAPGRDRADLLRAAFPGGSISGAPKVRALEIIEELEPVRRGVYCGAIGHLGFHGALDLNIAIRTAVVARGRFLLHSGGAVTADSDPGAEYEETLAKAEGFLRLIRATP
jgi:para-aminobenzoate synthetase component 1